MRLEAIELRGVVVGGDARVDALGQRAIFSGGGGALLRRDQKGSEGLRGKQSAPWGEGGDLLLGGDNVRRR